MNKTESRLEKLRDALSAHPDWKTKQFAKYLGVNNALVYNLKSKLKKMKGSSLPKSTAGQGADSYSWPKFFGLLRSGIKALEQAAEYGERVVESQKQAAQEDLKKAQSFLE